MTDDLVDTALALAQLCGSVEALSTRITSITCVDLVSLFLAREDNLVGVDDDDVVTSVNMRCVGQLILDGQNFGNAGSQTASSQSCSINDIPFASDVARIGHECCFH